MQKWLEPPTKNIQRLRFYVCSCALNLLCYWDLFGQEGQDIEAQQQSQLPAFDEQSNTVYMKMVMFCCLEARALECGAIDVVNILATCGMLDKITKVRCKQENGPELSSEGFLRSANRLDALEHELNTLYNVLLWNRKLGKVFFNVWNVANSGNGSSGLLTFRVHDAFKPNKWKFCVEWIQRLQCLSCSTCLRPSLCLRHRLALQIFRMLLLTELELANVFQDWSLVATGTSTPTRTNYWDLLGLFSPCRTGRVNPSSAGLGKASCTSISTPLMLWPATGSTDLSSGFTGLKANKMSHYMSKDQ